MLLRNRILYRRHFRGAKTFENALTLKKILIAARNLTTAKINRLKCQGPARQLAILGMLFDSINRRCILTPEKQQKYIIRLKKSLKETGRTSKDLEKMVGYLVYAAWVDHFTILSCNGTSRPEQGNQ